jgi:hypothetical protein
MRRQGFSLGLRICDVDAARESNKKQWEDSWIGIYSLYGQVACLPKGYVESEHRGLIASKDDPKQRQSRAHIS